MKWMQVLTIGMCLTACQTTAYQEKFDRVEPIGAGVNESFDIMIANAEQPKLHIGSVLFSYDDAVLSETAKQQIQVMAKHINQHQGVVILEGHASFENSEDYNQTLGYKRALAVAAYLRDAGVWEERLHIKSFGKSRPVASNHAENLRAENRRVDIRLLAQGEGISGLEAENLQREHTNPPKEEQSAEASPLAGLMNMLGGGPGM